jgi:hypothetical protein
MAAWSGQELSSIGRADEIRVAGRRKDGSLRTLAPVWHVIVDGAPSIRSMYGTEGQWYRGIARHFEGAVEWGGTTRDVAYRRDSSHDAEVDAAFFAKYGNGSPTRGITNAVSKQATLRIEPR